MPTQSLLDKFLRALIASKTFQSLTPQEQTEIKNSYANATDEQLAEAMEVLKNDVVKHAEFEAEEQKAVEQQVKIAHDLKDSMKKIEKEELKENAANDKEESSKAADALLEDLEKGEEEDEGKKKKKKFLGIF